MCEHSSQARHKRGDHTKDGEIRPQVPLQCDSNMPFTVMMISPSRGSEAPASLIQTSYVRRSFGIWFVVTSDHILLRRLVELGGRLHRGRRHHHRRGRQGEERLQLRSEMISRFKDSNSDGSDQNSIIQDPLLTVLCLLMLCRRMGGDKNVHAVLIHSPKRAALVQSMFPLVCKFNS